MNNNSKIFFKGHLTVRGLFLTKEKSLSKLTYRAISRVINFLILARYRLQYPSVKFGTGVFIRGHFSIKGNGKVEIGNYCSFVADNGIPNQILTKDSSTRITIGNHCSFHGATLAIEGKGHIEIGNDCSFVTYAGPSNKIVIVPQCSAHITIGDHCSFNGVTILANNSVEFKRQCLVSDALIIDTDFHSVEINRLDPSVKPKTKPVYIDENAWIGSRSVILKGVSIGKNSVIGLGTIVRQSVPDNVVVMGNPQRIVKELDTSILPYEFEIRNS